MQCGVVVAMWCAASNVNRVLLCKGMWAQHSQGRINDGIQNQNKRSTELMGGGAGAIARGTAERGLMR